MFCWFNTMEECYTREYVHSWYQRDGIDTSTFNPHTLWSHDVSESTSYTFHLPPYTRVSPFLAPLSICFVHPPTYGAHLLACGTDAQPVSLAVLRGAYIWITSVWAHGYIGQHEGCATSWTYCRVRCRKRMVLHSLHLWQRDNVGHTSSLVTTCSLTSWIRIIRVGATHSDTFQWNINFAFEHSPNYWTRITRVETPHQYTYQWHLIFRIRAVRFCHDDYKTVGRGYWSEMIELRTAKYQTHKLITHNISQSH